MANIENKKDEYFDESDEDLELPLERTVKAFVANISPKVPDATTGSKKDGNGESLDSALDAFVLEAKAWHATLPPTVVDDRKLADLAKAPVQTKPEPQPQKELPQQTSPPSRGTLGLIAVLCLVIGSGIGYAAFKLSTQKTSPPPLTKIQTTSSNIVTTKVKLKEEPSSKTINTVSISPDAAPAALKTPAIDAALPSTKTVTASSTEEQPKVKTEPVASAKTTTKARTPKAPRQKALRQTSKEPSKPKKEASPPAKKSGWVDPFSN